MKKIILFLLLFSQIVFAMDKFDKAYLELEKKLDEISYDKNTKDFSKSIYEINQKPVNFSRPFEGIVGIKAVEVDYVNGKREGKAIFRKPDGEILAEGEYKDDKKEGVWKFYFADTGQISKVRNYKAGKCEGEAIDYFPNGNIEKESFYANGKKNGVEKEYYMNSGKLWSVGNIINDKIEGKFTIYYPNGKIYMTGFYENDKQNGVFTYYYEKSSKILLQGNLKKGIDLKEWQFFDENGKVLYKGSIEGVPDDLREIFRENLEKALIIN